MQIILVGQCYISVLNNLPDHEFISIYIRVYIHTPIDNINSFIDLGGSGDERGIRGHSF